MKKNLAILSLTVLTSLSSFAGVCDFKISEPFDNFSSASKQEVVNVMTSKGYQYNEHSTTEVVLSTSSDLIGWSNNVFIEIRAFPLNHEGKPVQCGLAYETRKIAFLGGKSATVKKLVNEMAIPVCQEVPDLLQKCIKSYEN